MNADEIDRLKRLTTVALFSDDKLLNTLVLKGGNALSLVHNMTSRASFDLDFSMEGEFAPNELADYAERIEYRLTQAFTPAGYVVFDVKLEPKPENVSDELKDFWGGYNLEFKAIPAGRYRELKGDLKAIRREAIPPKPGGKARFEIDISRHEYCSGKQAVEIDHFTVYVYTPSMVVCEKLRAICQQRPAYTAFVKKHRAPRARDFFDICEAIRRFDIDVAAPANLDTIKNMFRAKRVPLKLLRDIESDREFHRQDWDAVRDTVDPGIVLRDFDFYFDFVRGLCKEVANALAD
ncbi:MAG: nucleotidyl transferase AbiEii/AbiGii toxin family protein [Phycisphaerae bacterium]